jgi:hypothetical protein
MEQAVWLRREGTDAVVLVETPEGWREVIRESLAGWPEVTFSYIKEPSEKK